MNNAERYVWIFLGGVLLWLFSELILYFIGEENRYALVALLFVLAVLGEIIVRRYKGGIENNGEKFSKGSRRSGRKSNNRKNKNSARRK